MMTTHAASSADPFDDEIFADMPPAPPPAVAAEGGGPATPAGPRLQPMDDGRSEPRPPAAATAAAADTDALSWRLKTISWPDPRVGGDRREVQIICQSLNGPCSLISLCNVLILRGSVHLGRARESVSYADLSHLIADFLVERPQASSSTALSLEAALEILPSTVRGLNVNPAFAAVGRFEAQGAGGELALFELCGVQLTHGWIPDGTDAYQADVLERIGTYDGAQLALVRASEAEAALGQGRAASAEQTQAIQDAAVVRDFLRTTQTQLTVSGLFALNDSLQERDLVALFRNSHLSVLYKRPADPSDPNGPLLYSLVTDESLLREPEVVWESIGDVEGGSGSFVNSEFRRAATAGGDFAGLTAEQAGRDEWSTADGADYDQQIARNLQEEEDARAARHIVRRDQERADGRGSARRQGDRPKPASSAAGGPGDAKKKKGCVVM